MKHMNGANRPQHHIYYYRSTTQEYFDKARNMLVHDNRVWIVTASKSEFKKYRHQLRLEGIELKTISRRDMRKMPSVNPIIIK